jgi:hypothetical protein
VGIDQMRNGCATTAVNSECDYVLFLDDDVLPPPDSLAKLLECDADIAAGDVIIRGYPFDHMCFRYTTKDKKQMKALPAYPKNSTIIDVDAVGFSLCLIKTSLIKQVPPPYFITGLNHTEDVYFCLKARDAVPECSIRVNTQLQCGHILYPEVISSSNKKNYKKYIEKQFPEVLLTDPKRIIDIVKVDPTVNYEDVMRASMSEVKK